MEERIYNYLGEDITDTRIRLLDSSFGLVDENNIPYINWGMEDSFCDSNGFDKQYRPIEDSEEYVIKHYILPKGTELCRYSSPKGYFTTTKGTPYEFLSLPYDKETIEYHEYIVTEEIDVDCYVIKGRVAPKFMSNGGGVQFLHYQSIESECYDGYLVEDKTWILKHI